MIWELAGIVGRNPGPLTLRELGWMAEARTDYEWAQTASILALTANCHRNPKKGRAFTPADFHPAKRKRKDVRVPGKIADLKTIFVDRKR